MRNISAKNNRKKTVKDNNSLKYPVCNEYAKTKHHKTIKTDIDISKWNRMKNNKHYLDYELYAENGADKKEAVA